MIILPGRVGALHPHTHPSIQERVGARHGIEPDRPLYHMDGREHFPPVVIGVRAVPDDRVHQGCQLTGHPNRPVLILGQQDVDIQHPGRLPDGDRAEVQP